MALKPHHILELKARIENAALEKKVWREPRGSPVFPLFFHHRVLPIPLKRHLSTPTPPFSLSTSAHIPNLNPPSLSAPQAAATNTILNPLTGSLITPSWSAAHIGMSPSI